MRKRYVILTLSGLMLGGIVLWVFWLIGARELATERTDTPVAERDTAAPAALPVVSLVPATVQTNTAMTSSNLQNWPDGEPRKLTADQAEAYVRENHRNASSLLAASRASGDKALLREAMEKYPKDPKVAFEAYFLSGPYDNKQPATPERRQWLENLKESDPKNTLPNYLAARDDFRAGRTDLALQELQAASGKTVFNDYLLEALQSTEEAYRSAGFSEADAKSTASWNLLLPHLAETRQLSENMTELASQYLKSGDTASAQSIVQMGLSLGQQVGGPEEFPLINTLVGIAIQKKVLGVMDPTSPYLDTGTTVQDQINALDQYRDSLKGLGAQTEAVLPRLSDADRVNFYDRLRVFGEPAAVHWAVEKYGAQ